MPTPVKKKEKINYMLQKRQWRALYDWFSNGGKNHSLDRLNLTEISHFGYTLEVFLENISKVSVSWNSLVQMDGSPQDATVADMTSSFHQWKRHLQNLPGENGNSGIENDQETDWFQHPYHQDKEKAQRLKELVIFWQENRDHIEEVIKTSTEPDCQIRDRILAEFSHYAQASEFKIFIQKGGLQEILNKILGFLKSKPMVAEAETILLTGEANHPEIASHPEIAEWKIRVTQARGFLAAMPHDSGALSEADDLKQQELFQSMEFMLHFKEHAQLMERLNHIHGRLDLVKKIRGTVDNDSIHEAVGWISQLPPKYQLNPHGGVDKLLRRIALENNYDNLCRQEIPDEKILIELEAEFQDQCIDPPAPARDRFAIARVRVEILSQLEEGYSPRKPLDVREEFLLEFFEQKEKCPSNWRPNWKDPRFLEPWGIYLKKKEKDGLEQELKTLLDTNDAKKAIHLWKQGEEALADTGFWQQNKKKITSMAEKGRGFLQLLEKIGRTPESNLLERELGCFRDPLLLPDEYHSFKEEIEQLLREKISRWKIPIPEIRPSRETRGVCYLGWKWPNKHLVNRVYLALEKDKFPISHQESFLIKETQPYEFDMLNSGTLLLGNAHSLEGFILTVWPGSEFFDFRNRKQWIHLVGRPQYFQWLVQKRKWSPFTKPEPGKTN